MITICNFVQAKLKKIEKQLSDTLQSSDARSTHGSESGSNGLLSTPKSSGDTADSLTVTKKLEEELSKRDALIEVVFFLPLLSLT